MKKIVVGYDAKRANANCTGLGNYSRFIIRALKESGSGDRLQLYIPKRKQNTEYDELLALPGVSSHLPDTRWGRMVSALWRMFFMAPQLKREGVELFHGLSNELPTGLRERGIRSIVTIHDLIFEVLPACYKPVDRWIYRWKFRSACERADRVVAVSECTKRDIVRLYGIDPRKIEVIYQGCDEMFSKPYTAAEIASAAEKYHLPKRFLLNVGTLEERKNLLEIVQALEHLPEEIHLVAVGRHTPYTTRVEEYAAAHGLTHRLHLLHKVAYRDLPLIYGGAEVMVYPSRYEGFGIPILEALNMGVPVVAATGSCLEEAGGPETLYVSPDSPEELAQAVQRILGDEALRSRMVERGREYVERFQKEVIAEQMERLYDRVIGA